MWWQIALGIWVGSELVHVSRALSKLIDEKINELLAKIRLEEKARQSQTNEQPINSDSKVVPIKKNEDGKNMIGFR